MIWRFFSFRSWLRSFRAVITGSRTHQPIRKTGFRPELLPLEERVLMTGNLSAVGTPLLGPPIVTGTTGNEPDSIGTLRLNDGNKVMLVANYGDNNVSELKPNGTGGFATLATLQTGSGPNGFVEGDFTGSGNQDFAVAAYGSNQINIFLGDGKGGFTAGQTLSTGSGPANELALGTTQNGQLFLASANQNDGTVSIFIDNGGTFTLAQTLNVGTGIDAIAAGDFQGQGKTDFVVVNFSSNTAQTFLGQTNNTWTTGSTYSVGSGPWYVATGDLDGTGLDSIVTANFWSSNVTVISPAGSSANYDTGANPTGVAIGDINGDAVPDIVTSNFSSGDVSVLVGNGNGTFQAPQNFNAGNGPNGDGIVAFGGAKLDVVDANQSGNNASEEPNTSLQGVVGQSFTGVLATVTDTDGTATASDFSAVVTWGDGNTTSLGSSAFTENPDGTFALTGAHTYAATGAYLVGITIDDTDGDTATASTSVGVHAAVFGTVSGTVFNDTNGDGQQQPGEPGLSGWTVNLENANGQVVASTQTGTDGSYSFANVMPGVYAVQEVLPAGWTQTAGPTENVVVDPNLSSTADFGNFQNITINGTIFNDLNGTGQQQPGDDNLAGQTIQLFTVSNGVVSETPIQTSTTDQTGSYSFQNLPPLPSGESYAVFASLPVGWTLTAPQSSPGTITMTNGQVGYIVPDIGGVSISTQSGQNAIVSGTGTVTLDAVNNNTIATINFDGQSLEAYVSQLTATETDASGDQKTFYTYCMDLEHEVSVGQTSAIYVRNDLDTAITAGDRIAYIYQTYGEQYLGGDSKTAAAVQIAIWVLLKDPTATFFGLNADGTYSSGKESAFSIAFNGNPDACDIAAKVNLMLAKSVNAKSTAGAWLDASRQGNYLARGQDFLLPVTESNFGQYQGSTVNGYVFNDANRDSKWEGGEPKLAGWTINLLNASSQIIATTQTAANGSYSFTNVAPGSYTVQVVVQTGWTLTTSSTVGLTLQSGDITVTNFGTATYGDWALQAQAQTNDPIQGAQVTYNEATVDLSTGALELSQTLDFDQSPGTSVGWDPALAYNSATVAPPVVVGFFSSDPTSEVPISIQARITWGNNSPQPWETIDTTGHQPGDTYTFALQVDQPVSTGVYSWQVEVQATLPDSTVIDRTVTGVAGAVGRGSGDPYGAGWGISSVSQLAVDPNTGDVLMIDGTGNFRLFTANGDGTYTNPQSEFGTLTQESNGTFTYIDPSQTQWQFNALGEQTLIQDADGQQWVYQYNSAGALTEVDTPDGGISTLQYVGGLLSTINEPGGRTVSISHDSAANLTGLVDEDGNSRTFTYNGSHDVTRDQWAPLDAAFSYNSQGLLTELNFGLGMTYAINSVAAQGLLGQSAVASVTNGLGNTWLNALDANGDMLQQTQPTGLTEVFQLDQHNQVVADTDPLGLTTYFAYQYGVGAGDLMEVIASDGTTEEYQYNLTFHEVAFQKDQDDFVNTNAYNSTGDLISSTNPNGGTTTYVWSNGLLMSTTDPNGGTTLYSYDGDRRLVATTDADGNTLGNTYDSAGNPATETDGRGFVTHLVYDGRNQLVSETDPNNNTTTISYDTYGNVIDTIDPRNIATQDVFNQDNLLVSETVASGASNPETTTASYDVAGNLIASTDAINNKTTFGYDADNRLIFTTDPTGCTSTIIYDGNNNIVRSTDRDGNYTLYVYNAVNELTSSTTYDVNGMSITSESLTRDGNGNIVTSTDGNGNVAAVVYDANGNVVSTTIRAPSGAAGDVVCGVLVSFQTYTYNLNDQVVTSTDGDGNSTTFAYDGNGNIVNEMVRDANGTFITSHSYTYDGSGNIQTSTDCDGNIARYTYDGDGNVLTEKVYDSANILISSESYTYDQDGNLRTNTDGDGNVTSYSYDAFNNVLTETIRDPNGTVVNTQTFTYDGDNDILTSTDGDGNVASYAYDGDGNVLSVALRDSGDAIISIDSYTYDCNGNVLTDTNGIGDVTRNVYDGNQLIVSTVGYGTSAAETTTYTYDQNGNIATITDSDNNTTHYTYDANGNTLTVTNQLGDTTTSTYDLAGNLISERDANGNLTTFEYDGNRLATETWYAVTGSVTSKSFTYDCEGNMLTATNSAGTYTMTYDGNRLTSETTPSGLTLSYTYDLDGNVTSIQDSQGGLTTLVYDGNEIVSKTYQDANTQLRVDFTYDLAGNLLTETHYSDLAGTQFQGTTQYAYDGNQLTSIYQADGNGNVLASYTYTYDEAGRLSSETQNGITTNYAYNAAGQLIEAGSQAYTYDANGNRTGPGYVIGANNQLLSDGTWNYTSDANGNLVRQVRIADGTTWNYAYDNANQMVSAVESDANGDVLEQAFYSYDAFGNRIGESVTAGGTTTNQQIVYSRSGILYADADASGSIQIRYVLGVGGGPDKWLARVSTSGGAWLLSDQLGSVRIVENLTGGVLDEISYDAFGNLVSETDASQHGRLGFQGGEYDTVTGTYHFGARNYNAATGRWDSEDPIGLNSDESNLYRMEYNEPTDFVDPSGLQAKAWKRSEGTAANDKLKDREFDFAGGKGIVSFYKNVTLGREGDPKYAQKNYVELEFLVMGSNQADPLKDTHWIQFHVTHKLDKAGKEWPRTYTDKQKLEHPLYGNDQTPNLDGGKDRKVFYDEVFAEVRRSATELSIFDQPTPVDVAGRDLISKGWIEFDSYLVSGNKVIYHVHWEVLTKVEKVGDRENDVPEFVNISGERTDRFVDQRLWGNELIIGYTTLNNGKLEGPIYGKNPIPEATRNEWKKKQ
jgi:RHS repeat-associated protein